MARLIEQADKVVISRTDTRVLLALLVAPANGYDLAVRCVEDSGGGEGINKQPLYHSLKSLESVGLISGAESTASRRHSTTYTITGLGKDVLADQIDRLQGLISLFWQRRRQ